jgi:hypothetical protein
VRCLELNDPQEAISYHRQVAALAVAADVRDDNAAASCFGVIAHGVPGLITQAFRVGCRKLYGQLASPQGRS